MEIHETSKYISWKFMETFKNISWKFMEPQNSSLKFDILLGSPGCTRYLRVSGDSDSENWKIGNFGRYSPDQLLSQRSYRLDLSIPQGPSVSRHRAGFVSITQGNIRLLRTWGRRIYIIVPCTLQVRVLDKGTRPDIEVNKKDPIFQFWESETPNTLKE